MPDAEHYDVTEMSELKLPKLVQQTKWNDKQGLSGRDIKDIRLHEVLYNGLNNWGMRLLANGRFLRLEACNSVNEQMLSSALFKACRKKDSPVNLDSVLKATAGNNGLEPYTNEGKAATWKLVAERLVETMSTLKTDKQAAESNSLRETLKELTEQLKEANNENKKKTTNSKDENNDHNTQKPQPHPQPQQQS